MNYKLHSMILFLLCIGVLFAQNTDEDYEKYFDLYDQIFIKFTNNYVDSLDKKELIKASFKGLLKTVDPYTKLYEGSSKERLEIMTKGKYGGVGMRIAVIRDTLTVISPMEDSPAYSEGIQTGDQILFVDTSSTIGLTATECSALIRGELGSELLLKIRRPYSKENIEFSLIRDNIVVNDIPYWGIDRNNIGYIRLKKFSKHTSKDFRSALKGMNDMSHLSGLVIDLRGNTGGLLSNALSISDQLVPKGELILETRGRTEKSNRSFDSKYRPKISTDIPLVVLINKSSASASEIVSGVIQDLDRGVILGQPSFGKGLVQRIFNINDSISLKVTTSKYYIPSGRLIQKMDYLDNNVLTDGLDEKDSTFFTNNGREVKGGGGITPDIIVDKEEVPYLIKALYKSRVFFKFASEYVPQKGLSVPIIITTKTMNDFIKYAKSFNIEYLLPGEKELSDLKNQLIVKYLGESIENDYRLNNLDGNSVIIDAQRWMRIRNRSGKTIRIKPPSSHDKNSGEYYFNELDELIPLTGFSQESVSELNDLTKDIESYFTDIKQSQYNNSENLKWIENALLREMSLVAKDEREKVKVSLYNDKEYLEAVNILLDVPRYLDLLSP